MKLCKGTLFLAVSVAISTSIGGWLYSDSTDQMLHDIYVQHDRLQLREKQDEARELLVSEISKHGGDDGPLDPSWAPLIRASSNGFIQLSYFVRVVEGDPDHEETYQEISELLNTMPDRYREEIKPQVVRKMQSISGINNQFMARYELQ